MTTKPKLFFLGTPKYASQTLESLIKSEKYEIVAVVTQEDKPAGRGMQLKPPPCKIIAENNQIKVFQPKSIKKILTDSDHKLVGSKSNLELCKHLNQVGPIDIAISVAYGKIIPKALIDFPKLGIVNIHPSLLPRWRGAAPIQWSLFSGDQKTGVCIMKVDEGLDTGAVYSRTEMRIEENDNLESLHNKLAETGTRQLLNNLPEILSGKLKAIPQANTNISYADKWERKHCKINWEESAEITLRRIRTCDPIPGALTFIDDKSVKVFKADKGIEESFEIKVPGCIVEINKKELVVACGKGESISIKEIQFPGKKRMPIEEALKGNKFNIGERFYNKE